MQSGQIPCHKTAKTASKSNEQHPHLGCGRGLWLWSEVMPEGVPMVGSPPDRPKVTGGPTERPMEETEVAREADYPSGTVVVADLDEMPPLEEDKATVELDAAIDKAGDEGEEGPETLDEADINEVARRIKDDPMLHMALGFTEPYCTSMALVVGVRKLHEYVPVHCLFSPIFLSSVGTVTSTSFRAVSEINPVEFSDPH